MVRKGAPLNYRRWRKLYTERAKAKNITRLWIATAQSSPPQRKDRHTLLASQQAINTGLQRFLIQWIVKGIAFGLIFSSGGVAIDTGAINWSIFTSDLIQIRKFQITITHRAKQIYRLSLIARPTDPYTSP